MTNSSARQEKYGFIRVGAVVPKLKVGDVSYNESETLKVLKDAAAKDIELLVFPELGLTGYTMADLFHQDVVQEQVLESLKQIVDTSKKFKIIFTIGLPIFIEGKLFNCGAVITQGKILGVVPKTYIPGYKEFYEERWFASARDLLSKEIELFGEMVPIGTDLLFRSKNNSDLVLGVEICEDLWAPLPPSSYLAISGATVIANLSASNEIVGKADYRRELIGQQSARTVSAYVYTSCGVHESTTDVVFGGHSMIAENGNILKESKRFDRGTQIIYADVDIKHLHTDRMRTTSFGESVHEMPNKKFRFVNFNLEVKEASALERFVDPRPFIPSNPLTLDRRMEEIFSIQSAGLAKRLEYIGTDKVMLGLSGGLDSTLALLVAVNTFNILGLPLNNIKCFTMPGFATSKRTKGNAWKLAETLGVSIEEIDITAGATQHLKDLGHDLKTQDLTFENTQARYRTMILLDKANQLRGLVIGTGDLSELALGWCTFNGDHISQYGVNAGIPKTLVKYLVDWVSKKPEFKNAKDVLVDVLDTPVSPELTVAKKGQISQVTEDIVGPYELHDFFLYHFLRWGSSPKKIFYLALKAKFSKDYSRETIRKWLKLFVSRFFNNQWKRSVMPDGPKVGSVALSPRGDWRMPSDAEVNMWLKEIEEIK
ncbi:MAG: NAD(+) synthase [Candidatus Vogelbacteria bacterium]|nr:NAD(+) synthase [Candidatus Vogelbacteria bacterium]